eukprot:gene7175-16798_t
MEATVFGAPEMYDGYSALQLQHIVDELATCSAAEAGTGARRPRVRVPHDPAPPIGDAASARLADFPPSRIDLPALRALAWEDGRVELVGLLRMLDDPAAFEARLK